MDHVICVNADCNLKVYRGSDLVELVMRTLSDELDLTPADWIDPDPEFGGPVQKAMSHPCLDNLEAALSWVGIDMIYSGPAA